jgi:hypothetical protein
VVPRVGDPVGELGSGSPGGVGDRCRRGDEHDEPGGDGEDDREGQRQEQQGQRAEGERVGAEAVRPSEAAEEQVHDKQCTARAGRVGPLG